MDRLNCPICHDWLESSIPIAATFCDHVFHKECILRWLDEKHNCPTCRGKVCQYGLRTLRFSSASCRNIASLKADVEAANKRNEELEKEVQELKSRLHAHQAATFNYLKELVGLGVPSFTQSNEQLLEERKNVNQNPNFENCTEEPQEQMQQTDVRQMQNELIQVDQNEDVHNITFNSPPSDGPETETRETCPMLPASHQQLLWSSVSPYGATLSPSISVATILLYNLNYNYRCVCKLVQINFMTHKLESFLKDTRTITKGKIHELTFLK
ncbi:hypothetical protein L596_013391 [Steinernema carpocapsae]|uniref:RING-type domain-containing protein n=1 Tax=Steinernema carpocapsae TaxID=34508 RepID=A0A4U5P007_STECR|nr:hypothetical protein L596_013391 [Steinernema carpocapsae]